MYILISDPRMSVTAPRPLQSAALSDPLYYLRNFSTLVHWVGERHADLLSEEERNRVAMLSELPQSPLALLVRMLMRRGDHFRLSRLHYDEIGPAVDALGPLIEQGWIAPNPTLDIESLGRLLTRQELIEHLDAPDTAFVSSTSKTAILEQLGSVYGDRVRPLHEWAPTLDDRVVELNCSDLFTRLQLMFFGNLNQDLSAFVLTELGYQRFEPVAFTAHSRAFSTREEIDLYLQLNAAREALENDVPLSEVMALLPGIGQSSSWLEQRRSRLLFAIARRAERSGDYELALDLYGQSDHPEARQRGFRVLELSRPDHATYQSLTQALVSCERSAEQEALARIERRLSRLLGHPSQTRLNRIKLPQFKVDLPGPASVEISVAEHLSRTDAPVYYVENSLVNGLFALLCWPALYAPLPGAFFNPFQAAPADLAGSDFVSRRQTLFAQALATLNDSDYKATILKRYREKEGIHCPFINWHMISYELVTLALECIPAEHLQLFFSRLLEDIPAYRSGLPDLIQLFPNEVGKEGSTTYRLIEVKGPGDKLQDNQRRWLEYLYQRGVAVAVCYLSWSGA